MKESHALPNGEYLLTNGNVFYKVYCHMTDDSKGWTLIARFSNNDDKNWMDDTGYWWYDKEVAIGTTTDPSVNTDAISQAFWLVSGKEFKITRSDDPSHTPLLQTTGSCTVQYGGQYKSTGGFKRAECNGSIQTANNIGFWCDWSLDGSVMMIGGGGDGCTRADHGIGITEVNAGSFVATEGWKGNQTEYDFGHNAFTTVPQSLSYSLNLWIR
ncbi:hypothetical protein ACROYT_G031628 [Oculina patagonica]